jgi:hypothetical protein
MEIIYIVKERYQNSDTDDWHHWVSEDIVSYHRTHAGATTAMLALVKEEVKRFEELQEQYPKSYTDLIAMTKNNKRLFTNANNGNGDFFEEDIYYVDEVQLKD